MFVCYTLHYLIVGGGVDIVARIHRLGCYNNFKGWRNHEITLSGGG